MIAPTTRIASKPSRRMIEKQAMKVATAADRDVPVDPPFSSTPSSLFASVRIIVLKISVALLNSSTVPPLVADLHAENCSSTSDFLAPEIYPIVFLSKPVVS